MILKMHHFMRFWHDRKQICDPYVKKRIAPSFICKISIPNGIAPLRIENAKGFMTGTGEQVMKKHRIVAGALGLSIALSIAMAPVSMARINVEKQTAPKSTKIHLMAGDDVLTYYKVGSSEKPLRFRITTSSPVDKVVAVSDSGSEKELTLYSSGRTGKSKSGVTTYISMATIEFDKNGKYTVKALDSGGTTLETLELEIK